MTTNDQVPSHWKQDIADNGEPQDCYQWNGWLLSFVPTDWLDSMWDGNKHIPGEPIEWEAELLSPGGKVFSNFETVAEACNFAEQYQARQ